MEKMLKDDAKDNRYLRLADVLLLRFSQMYDFDLLEAIKEKMEINNRKYPVEKSKGKNVKYNELY